MRNADYSVQKWKPHYIADGNVKQWNHLANTKFFKYEVYSYHVPQPF